MGHFTVGEIYFPDPRAVVFENNSCLVEKAGEVWQVYEIPRKWVAETDS